jgi:pSer/pThr/pTyr-binding forkhead associated (FHA) protein
VGRDSGQVDYFIDNKKVGRVHAEFSAQGGKFYVTDRKSTNGTFVGGNQIPSGAPQELNNEDVIKLADFELTFKC